MGVNEAIRGFCPQPSKSGGMSPSPTSMNDDHDRKCESKIPPFLIIESVIPTSSVSYTDFSP